MTFFLSPPPPSSSFCFPLSLRTGGIADVKIKDPQRGQQLAGSFAWQLHRQDNSWLGPLAGSYTDRTTAGWVLLAGRWCLFFLLLLLLVFVFLVAIVVGVCFSCCYCCWVFFPCCYCCWCLFFLLLLIVFWIMTSMLNTRCIK